MKLASFFSFRSRATKYGSIVGGLMFGAGAGTSAALSLKLSALCSCAVSNFLEKMGTHISIAELSGFVEVDGFAANFTLKNITATFPDGWSDLIKSTDELPPYCFSIPFAMGLCITTAISLALANAITTAIHIRDNKMINNDSPTIPLTMNVS
jgi:hypothetical protein